MGWNELYQFILHNKEFIDIVYKIVTTLIIAYGLYSLVFQKKNLQYTTTKDCIDIHRDILRKQQRLIIRKGINPEHHKILIRDHLGLITDELFYMRNNYLPKRIAQNWLRQMINFVPIKVKGTENIINEDEIIDSREISCLLHSELTTSMTETQRDEEIQRKYEEYLELALNKKSFVQVNNIFQISDKQFGKLNRKSKGYSVEYTEDNINKIVKYIWKNIAKRYSSV